MVIYQIQNINTSLNVIKFILFITGKNILITFSDFIAVKECLKSTYFEL